MKMRSTSPVIRESIEEIPNHTVMWMEKFGRQVQATRDVPDCELLFLDINAVFLDENDILSKEVMPDLLHPAAKGYELWAEAIEPKINAWLG